MNPAEFSGESAETQVSDRAVFRRSPELRFRRIGDETVIVHQGTARVIGLDEVGGEIFDLMDGSRNLEEILYLLQEGFEVGEDRLREDVRAFLEELLKLDLLLCVEGARG